MAKEPKASPSSRMYGKGPKIEAEPAGGDVNGAGDEAGAMAAAEETAGAPKPKADMKRGGAAKGDVMAGTDHMHEHHQHHGERAEMHHRHMAEHHAMHHRHQHEHLMRVTGNHHEKHEEMHERHHEERKSMHRRHEKEHREMMERHEEGGSGPTGGMKEKPEGKGGTEPKA